jgi:hypothetical protein
MITVNTIKALLANLTGTTFANIDYTTVVPTSAGNKHITITKHTNANVQLFNGIKDYANVYLKAVQRTANKLDNNPENVENFIVSPTWFNHSDDCFSLVNHNKTGDAYLFAIYNNAKSEYFIDGVKASKQAVATYLTPSASKALLGDGTVYNATNDVTHNVTVRTIALANINTIKAMGATI